MLCRRCAVVATLLRYLEDLEVEEESPDAPVTSCAMCNEARPRVPLLESMVRKSAQLHRFGLGSRDAPLLNKD